MSIIGSKYLENLIRLGGLVRGLLNGGYQETIKVVDLPTAQGRCYYDKCSKKDRKADRYVAVISGNGKRKEEYFLHSQCIDSLIKDERIPNLN